MRIERDEAAKAHFDEIIDELASTKICIFCNLTGKDEICLCLNGVAVFEQK